jgi:hypothetical protein
LGEDSICAELNKYLGTELWKEMQALLEIVWISEIKLEEWHTAMNDMVI